MDSFVNGGDSSSKSQNSASTTGSDLHSTSAMLPSSQPPTVKQSRFEGVSGTCYASVRNNGTKTIFYSNGSVIDLKHPYKTAHNGVKREELINMAKHFYSPHMGKSEFASSPEVPSKSAETTLGSEVLVLEKNSCIKRPVDDPKTSNSSGSLESESIISGPCEADVGQFHNHISSHSRLTFCPSPSNSAYTATVYAEAKQSFTNTEVSEEASIVEKSVESGYVSNSYDDESRKMSIYRGSTDSNVSDESSSSSLSSAMYKPHKANDIRWEAIQAVRSRMGALGFSNFKLLKRLGCGDIGSVHLAELTGTRTCFAMKVMDKAALAARKKLPRAQTEREILQSLDHPFLPTLYSHFETEKFSCLVMEFCPGGDLHALRQRQPGKYFPEHAARSETLPSHCI